MGEDINELPAGSVPIEAVRPSRVIACRTLRADVDVSIEATFDTTLGVIEHDLGIPVEVVDSVFGDPGLPLDWFTIGSAEIRTGVRRGARTGGTSFEPGLALLLHVGAGVSLADYLAKQRKRYPDRSRPRRASRRRCCSRHAALNVTSWPPDGPLPQEAGRVTDDPAIAINTIEFNFTGHPAVSVPMGGSAEGVPMGLEVIAPRFADRLALGLAGCPRNRTALGRTAPGYDAFRRGSSAQLAERSPHENGHADVDGALVDIERRRMKVESLVGAVRVMDAQPRVRAGHLLEIPAKLSPPRLWGASTTASAPTTSARPSRSSSSRRTCSPPAGCHGDSPGASRRPFRPTSRRAHRSRRLRPRPTPRDRGPQRPPSSACEGMTLTASPALSAPNTRRTAPLSASRLPMRSGSSMATREASPNEVDGQLWSGGVTTGTVQVEQHHVGRRGERTVADRNLPYVELRVAVQAVDRTHVVQSPGVDHLDRSARQRLLGRFEHEPHPPAGWSGQVLGQRQARPRARRWCEHRGHTRGPRPARCER